MTEIIEERLATKQDLDIKLSKLKHDLTLKMAEMKSELLKWFLGTLISTLIAQTAIIISCIKLLH